jgi:hypothetical protein
MESEIEELLILEEKVKNIKKRIKERKKSKTITIDGEAHETVKNHCASLNVNIGEWVTQTLLSAVEKYKEEINCLITDEIDSEEFQLNEKNRILEKYSKKETRHLFKSNKMVFSNYMKFVGHSLSDNYPIYEFTGDNILSFKLDIIESINQNDGLDITSALESEITKGWITDEMDYVVLSNKEVNCPKYILMNYLYCELK